jgi:hypothetical protein
LDFFISYTKADLHWAEWVAWQLEASGYTTVIQGWDFRPGRNFVLEMDRASQKTERTIAVLSPSYLDAAYTHPEWTHAFARDPKGEKGLLLPVRVLDCAPRGLLAQVVYIDLVGLDEEAAKSRLLAKVSSGRGKPQLKPSFPGVKILPKPAFPATESGSTQPDNASFRTNHTTLPPSSLSEELGRLMEIDAELINDKEDTITASAKLREWKKRVAALTGSDEIYKIEADDDRKGRGMYGVLRNTIKKCRQYVESVLSSLSF